MTKMPPEDAGLYSNKVHHPRGIGIFLLIAFRVTGQALIASASIMCLFTGDIYHGFGSLQFSSVQFIRSVMSDSLRPYDRSMPDFPVHHQLPESTQTHVHYFGDAIQPSHPLSSPSPPALNLTQHQGLFK